MSDFQVVLQRGHAFILKCPALPETPWLFDTTEQSLMLENQIFSQIVLGENNIIQVSPFNPGTKRSHEIPNYSFITSIVVPDSEFLESRKFEFNTLLDRLDTYQLPDWFGFTFSMEEDSEANLKQLLAFRPSCIALKLKPVQTVAPRVLLSTIRKVKSLLPANVALYIPGGAPIGLQTVLLALGVDILDTTSAAFSAFNRNTYSDGFIIDDRELSIKEKHTKNLVALQADFAHARNSLRCSQIWCRLFREAYVSSATASVVKILKKSKFNLEYFNLYLTEKINFIGDESLYHPVVRAYQERLLRTYKFPKEKQILLLLPCSAKKPYNQSRSHRLFYKQIKQALHQNATAVEVWSLTSPLSVVPRGLESVYPCGFYDIPVSGEWSFEESKLCGGFLHAMLQKVPGNVTIVVHVSNSYSEMVSCGFQKVTYVKSWIDEKPTSKPALRSLKLALSEIHLAQIPTDNRRFSMIKSLLAWKFGSGFNLPLSGLKLKERRGSQIVAQKNGSYWFGLQIKTAKINLSLQALETSNFETDKIIYFAGDKLIGSSLFAPGISEVGKIYNGDDFLIFDDTREKFLGIGQAFMSSEIMKQMSTGIVGKIKKKYKDGGFKVRRCENES